MKVRATLLAATLIVGTAGRGATNVCVGAILANGGDDPAVRVVEIYERLLDRAGAGVLGETDLRRLLDGDPFVLEPAGAVETLALSDGLEGLGRYARESLPEGEPWREGVRRVLQERLDGLQTRGGQDRATRDRVRPVADIARWVGDSPVPLKRLVVSADGRRVTDLFVGYATVVWDTGTGTRWRLPLTLGSPTTGAFSPDGKYLMLYRNRKAALWNVEDMSGPAPKEPASVFSIASGPVFAFVEGGRVLLVAAENRIEAREVPSGKLLNAVELPGRVEDLIVSDDGTKAASITFPDDPGDVQIWDESLWQRRGWLRRLVSPSAPQATISVLGFIGAGFTAGGSELVTVSHLGARVTLSVYRYDVQQRSVSWPQPDPLDFLSLSRDGRHVAFKDSRQALVVRDLKAGEEVLHVRCQGSCFTAGFAGDGHLWVGGDDRLSLWSLSTRRVDFVFDGPGRFAHARATSSGLILFEAPETKGLRSWNLKTAIEEAR